MILTPSNSAALILPFLFTVTFNLSKRPCGGTVTLVTLMFSSLRRFFLSSAYDLFFKPRPAPVGPPLGFKTFPYAWVDVRDALVLPTTIFRRPVFPAVPKVVQLYVVLIFIFKRPKDKNMKKLSLLLGSGKNEVYLERFINTRTDSRMEVRNAAVYWNFRNITKNFNNTVTLTSTAKDVIFGEGYWTFHMMAEKLAESDVKLYRNRYNNTCKIFSKDSDLNLKNLAPLLGFPKDKVIQANMWTDSPSNVDVNLGLRYVTVECSSVDTD